MKHWIALALILAALGGCSDGRPDMEEARRQFESIYPDAEVVKMQTTDNEVVARSFQFSYRIKTTGREGQITVQFMKTGKETWTPKPAPPKFLP
jgi:hypothetical protein